MPYLRCEQCAAKALPIATRCPSCETPFDLERPGRGSPRLRPCPECDSLLPREAASCRWCGAETRRRVSPPLAAAAAVAALALGFGGWALLGSDSGDVIFLAPTPQAERTPGADAPPSEERIPSPPAPARELPGFAAQGGAADAAPGTATRATPGTERSPTPESPPASDPVRVVAADDDPPPAEGGWVRAVARTFVNIRSSPASDGTVQGVVAENAVVLLGDAQGAWRRVQAGSVDGWVWEPLFTLPSEGP
jgi:hypothetical protein